MHFKSPHFIGNVHLELPKLTLVIAVTEKENPNASRLAVGGDFGWQVLDAASAAALAQDVAVQRVAAATFALRRQQETTFLTDREVSVTSKLVNESSSMLKPGFFLARNLYYFLPKAVVLISYLPGLQQDFDLINEWSGFSVLAAIPHRRSSRRGSCGPELQSWQSPPVRVQAWWVHHTLSSEGRISYKIYECNNRMKLHVHKESNFAAALLWCGKLGLWDVINAGLNKV